MLSDNLLLLKYKSLLHPAQASDSNDSKLQNVGAKESETQSNGCFEDIEEVRHEGSVVSLMKTLPIMKPQKDSKNKFAEYALLLRRIVDRDPRVETKMQLEIQSARLCQAFADFAKDLTTLRLQDRPIVIHQPFWEIFYCYQEIEAAWKAESGDIDLRTELGLLKTFQDEYLGDIIPQAEAIKSTGLVYFDGLWTLFRPGTLIALSNSLASTEPIKWYVQVKKFEYRKKNFEDVWTITVMHTGFNGAKFGIAEESFDFLYFSGVLPISHLPAFPCQLFRKERDENEKRGLRYEEYCLASS